MQIKLLSDKAIGEKDNTEPNQVLKYPQYGIYAIAIACILDVLSTFLPWGQMGNINWFLPFSVPIGQPAIFIDSSLPFLAISISLKIALITVLASYVLYKQSKVKSPEIVLFISIAFSIITLAISIERNVNFAIGPYIIIASVCIKGLGFILQYLEIEIVQE